MGIFSSIFGGKKQEMEAGREPAKTTGISYDSMLVEKLKEDHRTLVKMFSSVKSAALERRFDQIPDALSEFKLALQTHLAVENVRFYVYVQQTYAHDVDTSDFITGLRSEMNGIARVVVKFIEKYVVEKLDKDNVATFLEELEGIGEVLVKRVQLEEKRLYSLYHPA